MVQKCASLFLVRALWVHSNRKGYRDRMEEKKLEKNVSAGKSLCAIFSVCSWGSAPRQRWKDLSGM